MTKTENINVLMLGVTYKGIAFPLIFKLMPKRGNSNWEERIELMERFGRLFGYECIDCLVADREFVGRKEAQAEIMVHSCDVFRPSRQRRRYFR